MEWMVVILKYKLQLNVSKLKNSSRYVCVHKIALIGTWNDMTLVEKSLTFWFILKYWKIQLNDFILCIHKYDSQTFLL